MSKKDVPARATFMTQSQKDFMKNRPRTHANCKALTGVSRPGKTRRDRALGAI